MNLSKQFYLSIYDIFFDSLTNNFNKLIYLNNKDMGNSENKIFNY
jgi:hypothetical protein